MAETATKRGHRKRVSAADAAPPAEGTQAETRAENAAELGAAWMSPDALARALRAVAAELERDPALARRVASAVGGAPDAQGETRPTSSRAEAGAEVGLNEEPVATIGRTFHPSIVTGVAPDLGAGVPDPFTLRERLGLEGLRDALESLRLGSLRAIVREYKLDPGGRLSKLNDAAKLRERIVQAAMERK